MKRKSIQYLLGIMAAAMVTAAPAAFYAEEAPDLPEQAIEMTEDTPEMAELPAVEEALEDLQEEAAEEEVAETEDDFIEGSALLSDYGYEAGKIDEDGWESEYLSMKYVPVEGIKMDLATHEQMFEYYGRHGEDRIVANNEVVAKDENGYLQMMVEVNPNAEDAEAILERFAQLEELELVSKTRESEIAGKTFKTCTGIYARDRFMLGVCTDQDDIVIAFKIKYKDVEARGAFLDGFEELKDEEAVETVEEESTEAEGIAVSDIYIALNESGEDETSDYLLEMPEEFTDEAIDLGIQD